MNTRDRPRLHIVPQPLARIVPCPSERRAEMRRAISKRLEQLAGEVDRLASGAEELDLEGAALELELIAECIRSARARVERKIGTTRAPVRGGDDVG